MGRQTFNNEMGQDEEDNRHQKQRNKHIVGLVPDNLRHLHQVELGDVARVCSRPEQHLRFGCQKRKHGLDCLRKNHIPVFLPSRKAKHLCRRMLVLVYLLEMHREHLDERARGVHAERKRADNDSADVRGGKDNIVEEENQHDRRNVMNGLDEIVHRHGNILQILVAVHAKHQDRQERCHQNSQQEDRERCGKAPQNELPVAVRNEAVVDAAYRTVKKVVPRGWLASAGKQTGVYDNHSLGIVRLRIGQQRILRVLAQEILPLFLLHHASLTLPHCQRQQKLRSRLEVDNLRVRDDFLQIFINHRLVKNRYVRAVQVIDRRNHAPAATAGKNQRKQKHDDVLHVFSQTCHH